MFKFVALSGLIVLVACGSDGDSGAVEAEDPAEHACEHATEAGSAVSAASTRDDAPLLSLSEAPYTVELVTGAASYVKLEAPAAALLFAGTADVVTGLFRDGSAVDELPAAAPNELCSAELPEHFDLDLGTGGYTLSLGPAAVGGVWLMYVSAEGHAH